MTNILKYEPDLRYTFEKIESILFHFKTEQDFIKEFDLKEGEILGKGAFCEVKKCKSKLDK